MSDTEDGSNLDASTFDVDAWIDEVVRPEVTVELYPNEAQYAAEAAAIEAQIPAAEKSKPEDRGLDDPSPESLLALLADLKAERSKTALRVRVQQLTKEEMASATVKAKKAKAPQNRLGLWLVAAACVSPTFTPEQLIRLYERDASGEAMVEQLAAAVNLLRSGLTPPFSREPSGGSPA